MKQTIDNVEPGKDKLFSGLDYPEKKMLEELDAMNFDLDNVASRKIFEDLLFIAMQSEKYDTKKLQKHQKRYADFVMPKIEGLSREIKENPLAIYGTFNLELFKEYIENAKIFGGISFEKLRSFDDQLKNAEILVLKHNLDRVILSIDAILKSNDKNIDLNKEITFYKRELNSFLIQAKMLGFTEDVLSPYRELKLTLDKKNNTKG